ncbi:MAG: sugar phosphate isomerase/epimerase [Clostridia bacterium]|nr:sugar phosphate isomerase/epimerase [Clostridia bacterium]
MSKISLQMYTMRDYTKSINELKNTIEKLSEIGFKKLQYTVPESFCIKDVKKIFDEYGIENDSVFCKSLQIEEKMSNILAACDVFGTKHVRIDSIQRGLSSSAAGYKMFAHYLNEVSGNLKKHGIKLMYHFHAFEFIRFENGTGIEIFLNETDPEVIQIIPDTHWIQSGGKVITEFLEKYKDRYDYVHTKDFAIGEMGDVWENRPIEFAPVGEGNIDWKPIIDLCKKNNVQSFAIEQDDCYGRNPFDCVKSSFNYLKQIGVDA